MPSPPEMDVARIAAREQRAGLLAGGALTLAALVLVVSAVVAWMHLSAAPGSGGARPVRAAAVQAPLAPVRVADVGVAPAPRSASTRDDAVRASGGGRVD